MQEICIRVYIDRCKSIYTNTQNIYIQERSVVYMSNVDTKQLQSMKKEQKNQGEKSKRTRVDKE